MSIHTRFIPTKDTFYRLADNEDSMGFFWTSEDRWTMDYWTSKKTPIGTTVPYCLTDLTPSAWQLAGMV